MLWPFEYHGPRDRGEVTRLLGELDDARILAGGTDLLVEMRAGVRRPAHVVDLRGVEGLDELRRAPGGGFIGARVTMTTLLEDGALRWDGLREALSSLATYQVRNRATVVGNLCNASPAADCAPPLLVLGASVRVLGKTGETSIPLESFFLGVKKNAMTRGQWALGVEIPSPGASLRTCFMKRRRIRGHDLALVNVAGAFDPERRTLRIAVGACAPTPLLFDLDEAAREAKNPAQVFRAAWDRVAAKICPISDNRCCADYRTEMTRLFVERIISTICA
jgi:CO/xanthine dehydrogenase FAD-binding subunit